MQASQEQDYVAQHHYSHGLDGLLKAQLGLHACMHTHVATHLCDELEEW